MLHRASFFTAQTFAQTSSYTEKFLHKANFYTQQANTASSYTGKLLHGASFFTQQTCAQRSSCTEKLHREVFAQRIFLHTASFYTKQTFAQRSFYSIFLHKEAFTHSKFLHREAATQDAPKLRNICCQSTTQLQKALKIFRTQPRQRGTWTQPFHCDLQRPSCKTQWNYAQRLHKLQLQNRINDDFEAKRNFKRKIISSKMKKNLLPKHHNRNFHAATTIRFTTLSCKTQ